MHVNQNEISPGIVAPPTIWQELGNAMRGTSADYTQIGLRRAIFLLAVPMILELVMESTFAIADIYFDLAGVPGFCSLFNRRDFLFA